MTARQSRLLADMQRTMLLRLGVLQPPYRCIYCNEQLRYGQSDYCDALCSALAARDNELDLTD